MGFGKSQAQPRDGDAKLKGDGELKRWPNNFFALMAYPIAFSLSNII